MTPSRTRILSLSALFAAAGAPRTGSGADDDGPVSSVVAPAPTDARVAEAAAPRPDRSITFTATDFTFSGPATVEAGVVELAVDNRGAEDHQLGLFLLD